MLEDLRTRQHKPNCLLLFYFYHFTIPTRLPTRKTRLHLSTKNNEAMTHSTSVNDVTNVFLPSVAIKIIGLFISFGRGRARWKRVLIALRSTSVCVKPKTRGWRGRKNKMGNLTRSRSSFLKYNSNKRRGRTGVEEHCKPKRKSSCHLHSLFHFFFFFFFFFFSPRF